MRRFSHVWALLIACCSVGLIGATTPFPAPTVVVYPITSTGPTPAEAGGNVALLLATKIGQLGKVTVKAATPGTDRANYLTAAAAQGADYYITGYMTPVGSDVSLILQVVSTQSGSIIYSVSATVQTYSDVVAQADALNDAMVRHEERGLPSVDEVASAATPQPAVAGNEGINLTKALGRKAHAPQEAPLAFSGLVIDVTGSATPDQLSHAQSAIASTLRASGLNGEILPVTLDEAQHNAAQLCKANPTSVAFFSGTLENNGDSVDLAVAAQGCDGTAIGRQHSSQPVAGRGGIIAAIDRAAQADAVAFASLVKPLTVASKP